MNELATLETDGRVARITLRRENKRNALNLELLDTLQQLVDEADAMSGISVCVFTGAGKSFCAGMDLRAVLDEPGAPAKLLSRIAELSISIRSMRAVTVARVNGAAIGGGCGIVSVCDLAITHESAKLGFPEVDMGVCPAVVAPWLVARIGAGRARATLLMGGTMGGTEAARIGLVTSCVADDQFDEAAERTVSRLAKAGPNALRATKELLNDLDGDSLHAAVRKGAALSAEVVTSDEARAMLGALYK